MALKTRLMQGAQSWSASLAMRERCDLQSRSTPHTKCSRCQRDGTECRIRSSRRGKKANTVGDHHNRDSDTVPPIQGAQEAPQEGVNRDLVDTPDPSQNHSIEHDTRQSELGASVRSTIPYEDQVHVTGPSHDTSAAIVSLPRSYLGDSGFLPIFRPDGEHPRLPCTSIIPDLRPSTLDVPSLLLHAFEETFQEYCYTFYPILDQQSSSQDDSLSKSVLMQQAISVLGSRVRPPVLEHEPSSLYYQRAKTLFYMNVESDPLIRIVSVIFLQWMSAGPPNLLSLDSQYFWTGLAIRLAQEVGLYRDPSKLPWARNHGLRRRIFWTLFARERIFSLCQGRPYIIHLEDCDVNPPSIEDFPLYHSLQGEIFVYYVRLTEIIGNVSRRLNPGKHNSSSTFDLATSLQAWVQTLPPHLHLPFGSSRTDSRQFRRDVHQLHLPYLTAITLLYMDASNHALPKASATAVLAASCVARIFQDFLARGSISFVSGIGGWYVAIAILALLHGAQMPELKKSAYEQIDVLMIALREVSKLWYSSRMFLNVLEKHVHNQSMGQLPRNPSENVAGNGMQSPTWNDLVTGDGLDYLAFFPGHCAQTTSLFGILYADTTAETLLNASWPVDFDTSILDLFDQPQLDF